jgi:hypothetical protein
VTGKPPEAAGKDKARAAREQRLAAALRQNLKRRKAASPAKPPKSDTKQGPG